MDTGSYVSQDLVGGGYDIVDTSFTRPTPDVLRFAFESKNTYANGGGNVVLINSPQVDALVDGAAAATDPKVAASDYATIQRQALAEAWVLPVYTPVVLSGFSNSVHGITFDPQTYPVFYGTWLGNAK